MTLPSLERRNHGRGHSYWIGGVKVPGVTTILSGGIPKPQFGKADVRKAANYTVDRWDELAGLPVSERIERIVGAPQEILNAAGTRGTFTHRYVEQLQADATVEIPDEFKGYVEAYLLFDREWRPKEVLVERPFFHRKLMYAGTPDLVADLADGQRWLLDWKTTASGIWPENALQLAASRYAEVWLDVDGAERLVADLAIEACGAIHLRDDGSYELRPCEAGPTAFRAFLHAKEIAAFAESAKDRWDWVGEAMPPPAPAKEAAA